MTDGCYAEPTRHPWWDQDAFDLAGERSWDAPSDAERHPANRSIPAAGRPSQHPAEHVAAVRRALADIRREPA